MDNTSTFGTGKGQSMTMTGRPKERTNQNPGVGQYRTDTRPKTAHVRIGSANARGDVFNLKQKEELPGPGEYQSPEPKAKNSAIMGAKYELKPSTNVPGPGQYN